MNILVCVKRVPAAGAKIILTADEQDIDTRHLGFTISPHEECAVEEAIRLKEAHGGTTTVLTLGPEAATEQLRFALAQGIDRAVLLETDGGDWGPQATAQAIVEAIRAQPEPVDLLLFGNESADSGGYQVGIRVAQAFDLPCVTGIKALEINNGRAVAKREAPGGWEVYEVPLPAVLTVKEGINLPRYPSLPGRLRAKKAQIEQGKPHRSDDGLEKVRLKTLVEQHKGAEILGRGPEAASKVVDVLKKVGVL
jgi:electron transfer flavoprotein beta subunit